MTPRDPMDMSADRLRELLDYDRETGAFRWREGRRGGAVAGAAAGSLRGDGYVHVMCGGRRHYAHHLAWLWVHSHWPTRGINHIDGDPSNNAISNLREAHQSESLAGSRTRASQTGVKGVYRQKGRYRVQVWKNGKAYSFGLFDTLAEAMEEAARARRSLYGEFARSTGEARP